MALRFRRSNVMKGTPYLLFLALALAALPSASAQVEQAPRMEPLALYEPPEAQDEYAGDVGRAITRYFCQGVGDGGRCRIQEAWDSRLQGVCCFGSCWFGAAKCVQGTQPKPQYDLYGMFQKFACNGVQEGLDCMIPDKLSAEVGYKLSGKCCRGRCMLGSTGCGGICGDGLCTDQERAGGNCHDDCGSSCGDGYCTDRERKDGNCMEDCGGSRPPEAGGADFEGRLKEMEALACLGVADGRACNLPKDLQTTFGLSGVCCGGRCAYRRTICEKKPVAAKPDLAVSAIRVSPKVHGVDEPVNVTVDVKNIGDGPANASFWVRLRVEDRSGRDLADYDVEVNGPMAPEASAEAAFHDVSCPADANPCILKADVDEGSGLMPARMDRVDESREDNNFAAVGFNAREKPWEPPCGDGVCSEGEKCDADCRRETPADNTQAIAFAALAVGALALAAYLVTRRRGPKPEPAKPSQGQSVEDLTRQKEEIEKMLEIAKAKYHRRELDEESFREIVRDNQKRIIELELKIRVNRPFD